MTKHYNNIAKEIGEKHVDIKDKLLNILQINNQDDSESNDLKKYATNKLKITLKAYLNNSNRFIYTKL